MTTRFVEMKKHVSDALGGHGYDIKEKGKRTWRIDHDGTTQREVAVEMHDRWLCFREPLVVPFEETLNAADCWSYVSARPFNTSRGKVAVDPTGGGAVRFREEIPLGDGVDLAQACRNTVSSFAAAREVMNDPKKTAARGRGKKIGEAPGKSKTGKVPDKTGEAPDKAGEAPDKAGKAPDKTGKTPDTATGGFKDTLEDLCSDTGWAWSERGDGTPVAGLNVPGGGHQARLEATSADDYRIAVELNHFRSPSDVVCSAVAVYLLTANDLLHFARYGVDETEKGVKTFLEVCFFERPSPVLFDEALCALSVGVRFCEGELRALGDERVAQSYLRIRGWSPNGRDPSRARGGVSVKNPGRKEVGSHV